MEAKESAAKLIDAKAFYEDYGSKMRHAPILYCRYEEFPTKVEVDMTIGNFPWDISLKRTAGTPDYYFFEFRNFVALDYTGPDPCAGDRVISWVDYSMSGELSFYLFTMGSDELVIRMKPRTITVKSFYRDKSKTNEKRDLIEELDDIIKALRERLKEEEKMKEEARKKAESILRDPPLILSEMRVERRG